MKGASTAFRLMGWMLCLVFLASGCASHEQRVRVMTYNIHHGTDAEEQMTLGDVADLSGVTGAATRMRKRPAVHR